MRKTVRKTISFMLVFVMLLSYMSIGSAGLMSFAGLTASAEDKADTAESVLPPPQRKMTLPQQPRPQTTSKA